MMNNKSKIAKHADSGLLLIIIALLLRQMDYSRLGIIDYILITLAGIFIVLKLVSLLLVKDG